MKLVYIASPLRGDYNQNIKNAVQYCRNACEKGVLAFAPHIYFSQWCNDTIPEQREEGLRLGLEFLSKADELWVMGKKITQGMQGEILSAGKQDIPIFRVADPFDRAQYPVSTDSQNLLDYHSAVPGSHNSLYAGQVLILKFDRLKEEYRKPGNQLWKCFGGFGENPEARGRRVYAENLFDGEQTSFYRQDFCGIVKPEILKQLQQIYEVRTGEMETGNGKEGEMER